MVARASASRVCVVVLLSISVSGCLSFGGQAPPASVAEGAVDLVASTVADGLARLTSMMEHPIVLPSEFTVNVVFVGLDPTHIDTDAIRAALPTDYSPKIDFGRARDGDLRSGLVQNLRYEFHEAPDDFARALFGQYPSMSRSMEIPKRTLGVPGFLERYDAMYQLGRAASGQVHVVDAQAIEAWMEDHRDEAGLRFPSPQATIFFLDSYTKHELWKAEYYWYEYANESATNPDATNLRAWGGTHDFFFMDYSAAPNDALFDNIGITNVDVLGPGATPVPAPAPEGTAYNDPPVWHYRDGTARIGKAALEKTVTLTDRVRHALDVAVNLRILGDYLLPPVYAERYHINLHLWHDGRSLMPQEGLDELFRVEDLVAGLQQEVPWSNVTGSLKTYVAPRDDPGMAMALDRAKAEAAGTYIPTAPITTYIDAHRDAYAENVPGALEVMALLFLVEGHYSFVLPVIVGGVALDSPDGLGWGTISSVSDYVYLATGQDMDYVAQSLVGINAHEIGHFFGLFHAHDGYRRTATGYEGVGDHTWSSTDTVMSYRLRPPSSDHFHREHLARAHALQNLERTIRNAESVYRALGAQGELETPAAVRELLAAATRSYNAGDSAYSAGSFLPAVHHAILARRASEAALDLTAVSEREIVVAEWSTSDVNSAGGKYSALTLRPAVVPTGVWYDYKPVPVDRDTQRITVTVDWVNSPTSWGDFFAGWKIPGARGLVNFEPSPININTYVHQMGGAHDSRDEGPTDGAAWETFTLDLDSFPGFRDGVTLMMGAGSRGAAVDGGYHVEIRAVVRDHGDGPGGDG